MFIIIIIMRKVVGVDCWTSIFDQQSGGKYRVISIEYLGLSGPEVLRMWVIRNMANN